MRLFRISDEDQNFLAGQPETSMGIQVLAEMPNPNGVREIIFVISGCIAVSYHDLTENRDDGAYYLNDMNWTDVDDPADRFENWMLNLPPLGRDDITNMSLMSANAFQIFAMSPGRQPPQSTAQIYGHLPFIGATGPNEVYYRWESIPTSRRIDQIGRKIRPGTYAAPASELAFMPTGFSAVARQALPSLLPACFRWEMRPPAHTATRCGASVPLFGQSGGGVEVAFGNGFTNIGPIANPVVLPAL